MDKIKKLYKKVKYEAELYTMTNPGKAVLYSFVAGLVVAIILF